MKKIIILLLTLLTAAACQSRMDVAGELKKANGKVYHLTAPYKNTEITITFSGNSFSGFAGVNNYFGSIEIKDNQIIIKDIGRTRMAGPEKLMDIEEDYIKSLQASNKLSVNKKELRIGDLKFTET